MILWEIVLIAISLCMDTLALSVACGVTQQKRNYYLAFKVGIIFGITQTVMPAIGWFSGTLLAEAIMDYDHWVAFILLLIIGSKMIYESAKKEEEKEKVLQLTIGALFFLAVITSIDALAVGVSFALLNTPILLPIIVIGIVTFCVAFIGVLLGHVVGKLFQNSVGVLGGIILILLGLKILLEDLGVF